MELTLEEKERYNRHIIIDGFGIEGQIKLRRGKVLVIGAGGLGCPVIQYLVAAGVGEIGIVDADIVSLSNLQRQILYTENEIGQLKVEIAAYKMILLNSTVNIKVYNQFLDENLADQLFPNYDLVVGCTDSYYTRYLIDNKTIQYNVSFVYGAIREFEGQYCVFNYNGSTSYFDLFGEMPPEHSKPGGVVGAIPGIIGSLMAMEVIKIISEVGHVCSDQLVLFNALENSFKQIRF